MRAISEYLSIRIDHLITTQEVAELATAASKCGMTFTMWPEVEDGQGHVTAFKRGTDDVEMALSDDLARMAYLEAFATDRSVNDVLQGTVEILRKWDVDVGWPPADATGFGDRYPDETDEDD